VIFLSAFVCMIGEAGSEASKLVSVWEEVWTDATPGLSVSDGTLLYHCPTGRIAPSTSCPSIAVPVCSVPASDLKTKT